MGSSEVFLLTYFLFWFYYYPIQSPIGIPLPYFQVMCQVFNSTHSCRALLVSTGLHVLQSSNAVYNADISIPFKQFHILGKVC